MNSFPRVLRHRLRASAVDIAYFFNNDYRQCQLGENDLIQSLPRYLEKWGWQLSTEEFIRFWFETDLVVNKNLEKLMADLYKINVPVYVASNQEKYRAEFLDKNLTLLSKVRRVFYSYKYGCLKSDPQFFTRVQSELRIDSANLIYVDNNVENLDVAESLGWITYRFTSEVDCCDYIRGILFDR